MICTFSFPTKLLGMMELGWHYYLIVQSKYLGKQSIGLKCTKKFLRPLNENNMSNQTNGSQPPKDLLFWTNCKLWHKLASAFIPIYKIQ